MNMFASVIKETDKLKEQTERQRQGMVPDFYFQDGSSLADVKTLTCCKTRYPPARFRNSLRHDGVRIRQAQVHAEYRSKARKVDREYNAHMGTAQGPVAARLATYGRIKGLCCGAFGEGSPDLHKLCVKLVDSGAAANEDLGAQSTQRARIRASRYIYKTLGIEMMRGIAALR